MTYLRKFILNKMDLDSEFCSYLLSKTVTYKLNGHCKLFITCNTQIQRLQYISTRLYFLKTFYLQTLTHRRFPRLEVRQAEKKYLLVINFIKNPYIPHIRQSYQGSKFYSLHTSKVVNVILSQ